MGESIQRNPVELLADEFLERWRRGERPNYRDYARQHPELAAEIEDLFPLLAEMEGVRSEAGGDSSAPPTPPSEFSPTPLRQLGDYRILREIGRGGMGIVYEAEQVSLGRHVALKVLPKELLDNPKHRLRFEREAKAAAKLHHTNIVPVFGVGADSGLGYYVMQFIQGLSLDQVLEELKRLKREASAQGATAPSGELRVHRRAVSAEAVAQSLVCGKLAVLDPTSAPTGPISSTPQDAGPSSAAPAPRLDETIVHGSAALAGPAPASGPTFASRSAVRPLSESFSASNSSAVLPGSLGDSSHKSRKPTYWNSVAQIGVQVAEALHYAHSQGVLHRDIKPSNLLLDLRGTVWVTDFGLAKLEDDRGLTATGDILGTLRYMAPETFKGEADARSEVYSLGLTLYELLAFRPAFDERSRQSLIDQVLNSEITPLGKQNRDIPPDLQTIVAKAVEHDPQHRYATAQELADDLRRFLDDEPIKARRLSPVERLARWSRRNKGLAISIGLILALLTAVLIGSLVAAQHFRSLASRNAMLAHSQTALAEQMRGLADEKGRLADEKGRLADEKERERQGADEARRAAQEAQAESERQAAEVERQKALVERHLYASRIALARQHLEMGDSLNGQRILKSLVPAQGQTDRRGWEWHYLRHWSDSAAQLWGDRNYAHSIAFSPDGVLLATAVGGNPYYMSQNSAVEPGEVLIRDLMSGEVRATLREHTNFCAALAFSPDGAQLATAGHDRQILLWDVATGKVLQRVVGATRKNAPVRVDFSPNGKWLCVQWKAPNEGNRDPITTTIHSLPALRQLATLDTSGAAFAPGAPRLYWIKDKVSIRAYDLEAEAEAPEFAPLACPGGSALLRISPQGKYLAVAFGQQIVIWNLSSQQLVQQWHSDAPLETIEFSPNERCVATGGSDGVVRIWDIDSGTRPRTLLGSLSRITSLAFAPDSNWLATADIEGQIRLYRANRDAQGFDVNTEHDQCAALALDRQGTKLLSSGWNSMPGFGEWNTASGHNEQFHANRVGNVRRWPRNDFAFSPRRRWLAGPMREASQSIMLWDIDSGRELIPPVVHEGGVEAIALSHSGDRLATCYVKEGTHWIQMWDTATGQPVGPRRAAKNKVRALRFSPDDTSLASCGNASLLAFPVTMWRIDSDLPPVNLAAPATVIQSLAFAPDGKRLVGADLNRPKLYVWDSGGGDAIEVISASEPILDVAFLPNGSRIVGIGRSAGVHLFHAETFDELLTLKTLAPPTGTLGFTPRIAVSDDGLRIAGNSPHGRTTIWCAENPRSPEHQGRYQLLERPAIEEQIKRLTQAAEADPDAIAPRRQRAEYYARLGRWRESAADWDAVRRKSPEDRVFWTCSAVPLALAYDKESHARLCRELLAQFRDRRDADVADTVCKVSLLLPDAVDLATLPIERLRTGVEDPAWERYRGWFLATCTLASYRAGDYAAAIETSRRISSFDWPGGSLALVVRSMAEFRLGQVAEAKRTLSEAQLVIPSTLKELGQGHVLSERPAPSADVATDWLVAEVLRREAHRLIHEEGRVP